MVRNLLIVFVLLLAANTALFAQQGTLKGKVIDKVTKEPVPFANIIIENRGTQAGGAQSDIDGKYTIKPITPGTYDVKASYMGYKLSVITGIPVRSGTIEYLDVELEPAGIQMEGVTITKYKVPLIDKDKTISGGTVTSEEISKMPSRNVNSVATSVGGVFSRDGELGSIRGQRSEGNVMYIDGIRVRGSSSLPESAIEQVSVILGGVPAQYGDATGGIINVTTKGPSRQFGGGLELQSSQFLDNYGYNRAGVNMTGPIFYNKDKTSSVLGYFAAADVEYKKDGQPMAFGRYKVKDDVLAELEKTPLRISTSGSGTSQNAEYIHQSDLEELKSTLNSNEYSLNTSLKLDVKSGKNTNLTFGGSYNAYNNHNYNWYYSIFNYNRNSLSTGNTWRVFGRFTQRFPTEKGSTSLIKNVYYSLQADYTSIYAKNQDAELKDNLFGYGYVGKFTTYKEKGYDYSADSLGVYKVMNGYADTLVKFDRSELNPIMANYTTNYYELYKDQPFGHTDMLDNISLGGGLLNGDTPNSIYQLWGSPGTPQSGYSIADQQQATATLNISGDVGNHEIKLGFTFERTSSRNYSYLPTMFWPQMYQLANSHIAQLDLKDPINYPGQEIFGTDTIPLMVTDYHRLYDEASQRTFDKNLRQLMGLPKGGTDWIDINSYDINSQTINYYDENNVMKTITLSKPLSVDLFSPDEFLNSAFASARGYDYHMNRLTDKPSLDDFFSKKDANGDYLREIAPFEPIYMAGYIQDKFAFDDLVFNVGLRVDRFDANQSTLKDPYLLYAAKTKAEATKEFPDMPTSMGDNYVVYVDNLVNPTRVMGFRNGSTWYDADGAVVLDPSVKLDAGNGILPFLVDPGSKEIKTSAFADYKPQITVMPRISFSFPITDEALFYAHYDVLTQRPSSSNSTFNPVDYLFWPTTGNPTLNNPNLKPERTVDYELGYQQKLSNSSSLNISAFYREFRDQIQSLRYTGAYPKTYYSYGNIDFGTVKGLTVSYDLRRTANARIRASYTLQFANGTGSNAETSSGLIRSGQPNLRVLIPYDYDRRHAFNLNIDFRYGEGKDYNGPILFDQQIFKNAGFNLTINGGSGTPYTRSSKVSPFTTSGSLNGSRLPGSVRLDGRVDKDIILAKKKDSKGNVKEYALNVYLQVLNILNSRNIMSVYPFTGNPDDDGYLSAAEWQSQINNQLDSQSYRDLYRIRINSPFNYSSPRMIRLGLGFNF